MSTVFAYTQDAPRAALVRRQLPDAAPLGPHEVEIEVETCSVCHSDVHLVDGDWSVPSRPLVPGHEVVGRVTDAGSASIHRKGARVGLGWQSGACFACPACRSGRVHLCTGGKVRTCVGRPGGFATHVRSDARFVFPIPDALTSHEASPLLCAGLTVFSALERFRVGSGTRLGVVGMGGLGHLAVQFARSLGARVTVFDPAAHKEELARRLGAHTFVDAAKPSTFPDGAVDTMLVTTPAALDWGCFLNTLDLGGTLCLLGVPPSPLSVPVDPLLDGQKSVTGSVIGSPETMVRMLDFAATHGVRPVLETMPMSQANEALARVREGKANLRIVLNADA